MKNLRLRLLKENSFIIAILIILFAIGSIFTVAYLIATGNTPQVYDDIVYEVVAIISSNKTVEMDVMYILTLGGCLLFIVLYLYYKWASDKDTSVEVQLNSQHNGSMWWIITLFFTFALANLLIYDSINNLLLLVLAYTAFLGVINKKLVPVGVAFLLLAIYAVCGLQRIYVFFGGEKAISSSFIVLTAFFCACAILSFKSRFKVLVRACLIAQIMIPMLLLLYIMSDYQYNGELVTLALPKSVVGLILCLIIVFVAEAIFRLKKNWSGEYDLSKVFGYGTCVCIIAYNRFSRAGAIMISDMHHPFENIIGFSQIFELGQTPFSEYTPVSGMYSIVHGAIFRFFGLGEYANYNAATNIFYLLIILLITALLRKHLNGMHVFFLSLLLQIPDYNRSVFILPVMLALTLPKLIEKKNLWLKIWMLTSFFHGLYYPLFGFAVCIAFLPLGIWQIYTYVTSGLLKKQIKTFSFWCGWLISLLPVVLCAPWLVGMYGQVKNMSAQSLLADGVSRFGQVVPDGFFPYLAQFPAFRMALYLTFSFVVPALVVWVALAFALKLFKIEVKGKRLNVYTIKEGCIGISVAIMLLISYISTFIRLDLGSVFARSSYPICAGVIVMVVFAFSYLFTKKAVVLLTAFSVFVVVLSASGQFYNFDTKLITSYAVPKGYQLVKNDPVKKIGTGFLAQDAYADIKAATDYIDSAEIDREKSYMSLFDYFGKYYLNDIKGDSVIEMLVTVKGFDATGLVVKNARENASIIGKNVNPMINYYLYNWLMTSGEYIWLSDKEYFIPNDMGMSHDEVLRNNKSCPITPEQINISKYASSYGTSMDSLNPIFSSLDTNFTARESGNGLALTLPKYIDGDTADFLYVEFQDLPEDTQYFLHDFSGESPQEASDPEKSLMQQNNNPGMQVQIVWLDDNEKLHSMTCIMGDGRLLIPLGVGSDWLLNEHNLICITVQQDGVEIPLPTVSNIRFLKLREVG